MRSVAHSRSRSLSFVKALHCPAAVPMMSSVPDVIDFRSPAEAKIALFRSLFRGRDDVYPRRFESRRTGKSGYQPACANEWVRGVCDKPKIKCTVCPNRRFLQVTDEAIRCHLSGNDGSGQDFVMGVYPMLQDETCFFLAIDFDKANWREDVQVFLETCGAIGVPAALERSRSGNGAHVWIFFEQATPAAVARRLGSHLLTEAMERRPDIGFDSYDRFFPNQDTLPRGGFGNLIALPLQKQPRQNGNTVFLDKQFVPYQDQWAFLSRIGKLSEERVERIVRDAAGRGRIMAVRFVAPEEEDDLPWDMPPSRQRKDPPIVEPLPTTVEVVMGDQLYVAKERLPAALRNRLLSLAAFQNPEFYKAQAMRLPTYDTPRVIACAEEFPQHIGLPRGCSEDALSLLSKLRIKPILRDERNAGRDLEVEFQGELRPEQNVAAEAMLAHDTGVLAATTAFGKTVLAAWCIAQRKVNTLVLVHRRQLLEQWVARLSSFLGLSPKEIGRIGGGKKRPNGLLDVALIQSFIRKGVVQDQVAEYGQIIVDECHHLSARSFEQVVRRAKAKFVIGLSATVTRKDGHQPIIFMQCGPVRHRVDAKRQAAARPFKHKVYVRPTAFQAKESPDPDVRRQFHDLYEELIANEERNGAIIEEIVQTVQEGRSPVVLTERNDHLDELARRLSTQVRHVVVLRGGMSGKQLASVSASLAAIPETEERVLLATGKFLGEGFDDARLDTLFLTLPVSWHGTIAQYVGRLHRLRDGKREVRVYDYADLNVPMLSRMFDRRCRGYEAVGYSIELPASAVPGWPSDVPLPVETAWKRDYAASVQRLVRDGVDVPLANLFVHATRVTAESDGVHRARSASEAFFYRRLESLPETAGKFRLNTLVPIPFDGSGQMEIDLLCMESRIAVELDGNQHLSDTQAYRRDRRKDQLLQENGYLVLRFLADDIGKRLDEVLDAILRALSNRIRVGIDSKPVSEFASASAMPLDVQIGWDAQQEISK